MMKVLDLFSGLGGFSQAFRDRGHEVVTVDIEAGFRPSIRADIRHLPIKSSARFDVILASPPCDEFAKASMPWLRKDAKPDITLLKATIRVIHELRPRFWVIENVRGAIPFFHPVLGRYRQRCGSRYLWGNFPRFRCEHVQCFGKERLPPSPLRKALRSRVPYELSLKLCIAIENTLRSNLHDVWKAGRKGRRGEDNPRCRPQSGYEPHAPARLQERRLRYE